MQKCWRRSPMRTSKKCYDTTDCTENQRTCPSKQITEHVQHISRFGNEKALWVPHSLTVDQKLIWMKISPHVFCDSMLLLSTDHLAKHETFTGTYIEALLDKLNENIEATYQIFSKRKYIIIKLMNIWHRQAFSQ